MKYLQRENMVFTSTCTAHGDRTNERHRSVLWPVAGELLGGGVWSSLWSSLLEDKEEEKKSQILLLWGVTRGQKWRACHTSTKDSCHTRRVA